MCVNLVYIKVLNGWKIINSLNHLKHNHEFSDSSAAHSIHQKNEINCALISQIQHEINVSVML